MGERTRRHNMLEVLALRVARLNPDAGEIGAGMLRSLVEEARELIPYWSIPDQCSCCGSTEHTIGECRHYYP